jgi:hypothetical protein
VRKEPFYQPHDWDRLPRWRLRVRLATNQTRLMDQAGYCVMITNRRPGSTR